jgi:prepilin-type N-terminal cleavage/methylation domain-containing protein
MSPSPVRRRARDRGFTLLEVMAAIFILTVGTVSMALLATTMLTRGRQSKYVTLASTLTSEKLEDLNRYASDAPQVCVPAASNSEGSLTSDVLQTTTCDGGTSASVAYDDDVSINFTTSTDCTNSTFGCYSETVSSVNNGATVYTTTYHSPDGVVTTKTGSSAPSGNLLFHRRWIIESNAPVAGTRRVTVLSSLVGATNPPVTFQMSMVRP